MRSFKALFCWQFSIVKGARTLPLAAGFIQPNCVGSVLSWYHLGSVLGYQSTLTLDVGERLLWQPFQSPTDFRGATTRQWAALVLHWESTQLRALRTAAARAISRRRQANWFWLQVVCWKGNGDRLRDGPIQRHRHR